MAGRRNMQVEDRPPGERTGYAWDSRYGPEGEMQDALGFRYRDVQHLYDHDVEAEIAQLEEQIEQKTAAMRDEAIDIPIAHLNAEAAAKRIETGLANLSEFTGKALIDYLKQRIHILEAAPQADPEVVKKLEAKIEQNRIDRRKVRTDHAAAMAEKDRQLEALRNQLSQRTSADLEFEKATAQTKKSNSWHLDAMLKLGQKRSEFGPRISELEQELEEARSRLRETKQELEAKEDEASSKTDSFLNMVNWFLEKTGKNDPKLKEAAAKHEAHVAAHEADVEALKASFERHKAEALSAQRDRLDKSHRRDMIEHWTSQADKNAAGLKEVNEHFHALLTKSDVDHGVEKARLEWEIKEKEKMCEQAQKTASERSSDLEALQVEMGGLKADLETAQAEAAARQDELDSIRPQLTAAQKLADQLPDAQAEALQFKSTIEKLNNSIFKLNCKADERQAELFRSIDAAYHQIDSLDEQLEVADINARDQKALLVQLHTHELEHMQAELTRQFQRQLNDVQDDHLNWVDMVQDELDEERDSLRTLSSLVLAELDYLREENERLEEKGRDQEELEERIASSTKRVHELFKDTKFYQDVVKWQEGVRETAEARSREVEISAAASRKKADEFDTRASQAETWLEEAQKWFDDTLRKETDKVREQCRKKQDSAVHGKKAVIQQRDAEIRQLQHKYKLMTKSRDHYKFEREVNDYLSTDYEKLSDSLRLEVNEFPNRIAAAVQKVRETKDDEIRNWQEALRKRDSTEWQRIAKATRPLEEQMGKLKLSNDELKTQCESLTESKAKHKKNFLELQAIHDKSKKKLEGEAKHYEAIIDKLTQEPEPQ